MSTFFITLSNTHVISRAINDLGQIITDFLQDLSEATGWAFTVLTGGLNKTSEVKMATYVLTLFMDTSLPLK